MRVRSNTGAGMLSYRYFFVECNSLLGSEVEADGDGGSGDDKV